MGSHLPCFHKTLPPSLIAQMPLLHEGWCGTCSDQMLAFLTWMW